MNILVTGGAGFIGSHVVEKLLQEKCRVSILDNLSTGLKKNISAEVPFYEMDIRDEKLMRLFESEHFDAVIHLAAQTMVPVSIEKPKYDSHINILGTVNVLEACRKTGVKRVVFSSTAAVYGDVATIPVVETANMVPASFYGLSKLTVEKYLELYHQIYGLDYVVLRYANVYGERQGDGGEGGVVSIFTRKVWQGETVMIYGDGGQTRDFIYAGDVAAANWQALNTPNSNAVYNISTRTETSVNELIRILAKLSGKKIEKVNHPAREGDIYRSTLDNTLAIEKLRWKPRVTLTEGLDRTYRCFANK